jgi:peptide/nickel transport system substrate-binding protein
MYIKETKMKTKVAVAILSVLMILTMALTSCTKEATPTPTATPATTMTTAPTNWWDKFGKPQYGGTITCRGLFDNPSFDPLAPVGHGTTVMWFESLFGPDWALDPDVWAYDVGWIPQQYYTGLLAEGWERTGPLTVVVKLRQGIHWQDKPPVNGRELTAEDVQYSYDRMMGTGSGFTEPNSFWAGALTAVERVVATGKYTLEFRLKQPSVIAMDQVLGASVMGIAVIVPHEWVEQGDTQDWQNAVGTGPFILSGYETEVSLTYTRNPNYWGYDERHPENQLPYIDEFKYVKIPDTATALAAMRTNKIDILGRGERGSAVTWQQLQGLINTNPDIQVGVLPASGGQTLELRCDKAPFTDIRVRKALQMALDRKLIAESHYPGPLLEGQELGAVCGMAPPSYKGWVTPFDEWPADLQEEYSYNPDKARQLLSDAGYPNGFSTHVLASSTDDVELLEIIKSYFKDIGVDMEIKTMDSTAAVRSIASAGKHEQMVMSARMGMAQPPDLLLRLSVSTNTRDNFTYHNDAYFDGLAAQFNTATDTDEAKRLFNEADMYLISHHWRVVTCLVTTPSVWQPWIKGLNSGSPTPNLSVGCAGFFPARVWIDQGYVK